MPRIKYPTVEEIIKTNKKVLKLKEKINEELDRALSNPKVKDFVIALGEL
ncbi:MAG: hypothetical protein AABX34_00145 [Nanoarchaeota archaeon]